MDVYLDHFDKHGSNSSVIDLVSASLDAQVDHMGLSCTEYVLEVTVSTTVMFSQPFHLQDL